MTALFADAPALPLHTAGPYVAAAYVFFLAILIVYIAIMAAKLSRMRRDVAELSSLLDQRDRREAAADQAANGGTPRPTSESEADAVAARTIVKEPSQ